MRPSVDAATKLWSMGVPFNEINQRLELGFDDIEGGDTGYLGSGLLPSNFDWSGGSDNVDAATAKAMALLGYGKPNSSGGCLMAQVNMQLVAEVSIKPWAFPLLVLIGLGVQAARAVGYQCKWPPTRWACNVKVVGANQLASRYLLGANREAESRIQNAAIDRTAATMLGPITRALSAQMRAASEAYGRGDSLSGSVILNQAQLTNAYVAMYRQGGAVGRPARYRTAESLHGSGLILKKTACLC